MTFMRYNSLKIGGALYIIAVFQFFVFELVAETLYPGFSISNNYISDLGATCSAPPSIASCAVYQPSATIYDTTVFLLGLMLLAGTFFVYIGTRKKAYGIAALVADLAILLTGLFPENTGWIHAIISEFAFAFTGISLILAWQLAKKGGVFRYLIVAFGILTLGFTFFGGLSDVIGVGGEEWLIVFPALLGVLALGGHLTGQDSPTRTAKRKAPTQAA